MVLGELSSRRRAPFPRYWTRGYSKCARIPPSQYTIRAVDVVDVDLLVDVVDLDVVDDFVDTEVPVLLEDDDDVRVDVVVLLEEDEMDVDVDARQGEPRAKCR